VGRTKGRRMKHPWKGVASNIAGKTGEEEGGQQRSVGGW